MATRFISTCSRNELADAFKMVSVPRDTTLSPSSKAEFMGEINENGFNLTKARNYNVASAPFIPVNYEATFEEKIDGTSITIKTKQTTFSAIFSIVCLALLILNVVFLAIFADAYTMPFVLVFISVVYVFVSKLTSPTNKNLKRIIEIIYNTQVAKSRAYDDDDDEEYEDDESDDESYDESVEDDEADDESDECEDED